MTDSADKQPQMDVPFEDPMSSLPPTARALLEAARQQVLASGIDSVTVEGVTSAAGANRAAVSYYFGGKAGLMAMVVDSTIHDICVDIVESTRSLPPGRPRVDRFVNDIWQMIENEDAYWTLFGILPYALKDPALHQRLAALFAWYRRLNGEALSGSATMPESTLSQAALLFAAVSDGLALQRLVEGTAIDARAAYDLFCRLLLDLLAEADAER